jgi:hypothetical protein
LPTSYLKLLKKEAFHFSFRKFTFPLGKKSVFENFLVEVVSLVNVNGLKTRLCFMQARFRNTGPASPWLQGTSTSRVFSYIVHREVWHKWLRTGAVEVTTKSWSYLPTSYLKLLKKEAFHFSFRTFTFFTGEEVGLREFLSSSSLVNVNA